MNRVVTLRRICTTILPRIASSSYSLRAHSISNKQCYPLTSRLSLNDCFMTKTTVRPMSEAVVTPEEIETRVLDVLASFEKIDKSKVSLDASFTGDLSLDSLDVVEVVMAFEEEFEVEIPDNVADSIKTPREAVEYLKKQLIPDLEA